MVLSSLGSQYLHLQGVGTQPSLALHALLHHCAYIRCRYSIR